MLSIPPATKQSPSPALIPCAASMIALSPEPQTLFSVRAHVSGGRPEKSAACLAGFWPNPADTTFPIMTSSISVSLIPPARLSASLMTIAPSFIAEYSRKVLPNFPMGIRTELTMMGVFSGDRNKSGQVSTIRARRNVIFEYDNDLLSLIQVIKFKVILQTIIFEILGLFLNSYRGGNRPAPCLDAC